MPENIIRLYAVSRVGAGLLAKAVYQSTTLKLTHRFREQARSHIRSGLLADSSLVACRIKQLVQLGLVAWLELENPRAVRIGVQQFR